MDVRAGRHTYMRMYVYRSMRKGVMLLRQSVGQQAMAHIIELYGIVISSI